MTHKSRLQSSASRRTILLQGIACAADVAASVGPASLANAAKIAQAAVGYQSSPKGTQQCDSCTLFQAPSSCKLVDGTISASGWCKFYAKKAN